MIVKARIGSVREIGLHTDGAECERSRNAPSHERSAGLVIAREVVLLVRDLALWVVRHPSRDSTVR